MALKAMLHAFILAAGVPQATAVILQDTSVSVKADGMHVVPSVSSQSGLIRRGAGEAGGGSPATAPTSILEESAAQVSQGTTPVPVIATTPAPVVGMTRSKAAACASEKINVTSYCSETLTQEIADKRAHDDCMEAWGPWDTSSCTDPNTGTARTCGLGFIRTRRRHWNHDKGGKCCCVEHESHEDEIKPCQSGGKDLSECPDAGIAKLKTELAGIWKSRWEKALEVQKELEALQKNSATLEPLIGDNYLKTVTDLTFQKSLDDMVEKVSGEHTWTKDKWEKVQADKAAAATPAPSAL